jgi:hypothetical protein
MTTARQLYAFPSESVPQEQTVFSIEEHLYEVSNNIPYNLDTSSISLKIKVIKDHCYDGRRTWTLKTVWYEEKPFMIVQNAGREGEDYQDRFITDVPLYRKAVSALLDLVSKEDDIMVDVIDLDEERSDLDSFYSQSLDDTFGYWK